MGGEGGVGWGWGLHRYNKPSSSQQPSQLLVESFIFIYPLHPDEEATWLSKGGEELCGAEWGVGWGVRGLGTGKGNTPKMSAV